MLRVGEGGGEHDSMSIKQWRKSQVEKGQNHEMR